MKRTRVDEDFNPVYPYDTTSTPAVPFISPPFVNSDGLQENPPGILSLRIDRPLYFNTQRQLALSLGNGLAITAGGELESTLSVRPNPPLVINGNSLSLRYSDPLRVVNDSLTFNFTSPLRFESGSLTFHYASPLKLMNDSLALDVEPSKGLSTDGNKLAVKLSSDLKFDNNGAIAFGIQSLWTAPTTTPNCMTYAENDSLLSLCLTKCGAHVLGSVSLTGFTGDLLNMKQTTVSIEFRFDDNGILTTSPLVNSSSWGIRQNNGIYPNPVYNALAFMPNSTVYSRGGGGEPRNNYYTQTYLRGNTQIPITLSVTYNSANTGYSLTFKWTALTNQKFAAPTASFCYISEQ